MEDNQKLKYNTPETTVFTLLSEGCCMVPSSWGHEEG